MGHNLKFDLKYLYSYGIEPYAVFDTMIASQLLGGHGQTLSSKGGHALLGAGFGQGTSGLQLGATLFRQRTA